MTHSCFTLPPLLAAREQRALLRISNGLSLLKRVRKDVFGTQRLLCMCECVPRNLLIWLKRNKIKLLNDAVELI